MPRRLNSCLVLGGSAIDLISKPDSDAPAKDDHGLSLPGSVVLKFGGVARNVAELVHRYARSSFRVQFLTALGSSDAGQIDTFGELLLADCNRLKLPVLHCLVPGSKTSFYNANLHASGELRAAVCDFKCLEQVTPNKMIELLHRAMKATYLVCDANSSPRALLVIAAHASQKSIPIVALATSTPKVVRWAPLLDKISVLIMNRAELAALLSALFPGHVHSEAPPSRISDEIANQLNLLRKKCRADIICTAGDKGAFVLDSNGLFLHVPAQPCPTVVDVTGAGDSLAAGVVIGLLNNFSLQASVELGAVLAAQTISAGSIRPQGY